MKAVKPWISFQNGTFITRKILSQNLWPPQKWCHIRDAFTSRCHISRMLELIIAGNKIFLSYSDNFPSDTDNALILNIASCELIPIKWLI